MDYGDFRARVEHARRHDDAVGLVVEAYHRLPEQMKPSARQLVRARLTVQASSPLMASATLADVVLWCADAIGPDLAVWSASEIAVALATTPMEHGGESATMAFPGGRGDVLQMRWGARWTTEVVDNSRDGWRTGIVWTYDAKGSMVLALNARITHENANRFYITGRRVARVKGA